jgi:hypothetical protein
MEKMLNPEIKFADQEESWPPQVMDYPDILAGKALLVGAAASYHNPSKKISIRFGYPMTNQVWFEFESEAGFGLIDLLRCIHDGYVRIYAAEKDPGTLPNMYNRARSTGPYGIWGHVVDDLCVEQIREISPEKYKLGIGS